MSDPINVNTQAKVSETSIAIKSAAIMALIWILGQAVGWLQGQLVAINQPVAAAPPQPTTIVNVQPAPAAIVPPAIKPPEAPAKVDPPAGLPKADPKPEPPKEIISTPKAETPAPSTPDLIPVQPPPSTATPSAVATPAPRKPTHRFTWHRPRVPANHARTGYRTLYGVSATNPTLVDWRSKDSPIEDQGSLGSCTSFGWAGALRFRARLLGLADFVISHLWIYWCERSIEGTTCCDDGAAVQDGAQVVAKQGYPPETAWPYVVNAFATAPPQSTYALALPNIVTPAPASVDNTDLDETRTALANGQPIVFGFDTYASFDNVASAGLYTPAGSYLGGHCVSAIGYDDSKSALICRNSWGTSWGAVGYFYMPYSVYTDARTTSDAWTLPIAPLPAPPPVPPTPAPGPAPQPGPPPGPTPAPPTTETYSVSGSGAVGMLYLMRATGASVMNTVMPAAPQSATVTVAPLKPGPGVTIAVPVNR